MARLILNSCEVQPVPSELPPQYATRKLPDGRKVYESNSPMQIAFMRINGLYADQCVDPDEVGRYSDEYGEYEAVNGELRRIRARPATAVPTLKDTCSANTLIHTLPKDR